MDTQDSGEQGTPPSESPTPAPLPLSPHGGIRGEYTTTWRDSSDLRLAGRALLEDWENPPEKRKALMDMLYGTALGNGEVRDRLYAANVIAKLAGLNVAKQRASDGSAMGSAKAVAEAVLELAKLGRAAVAAPPTTPALPGT